MAKQTNNKAVTKKARDKKQDETLIVANKAGGDLAEEVEKGPEQPTDEVETEIEETGNVVTQCETEMEVENSEQPAEEVNNESDDTQEEAEEVIEETPDTVEETSEVVEEKPVIKEVPKPEVKKPNNLGRGFEWSWNGVTL